MKLTPIQPDIAEFPAEFHSLLRGAALYDSSCSQGARVIFIDKNQGYFLKSAPAGTMAREAEMMRYFHGKGLSAEVLSYLCEGDRDWFLTAKIPGDDCTAATYLEQPERLCDLLAEQLLLLHSVDCTDCPAPTHTERNLAIASHHFHTRQYNAGRFPGNRGYDTPEAAYAVIEGQKHLLQADTLLHGDCCLPNILLDDWKFSGYIDLGSSGVGDRHADLFSVLWSLSFNLGTDKYRQRFIDAYGRDRVDEERLRLIAAIEVFASSYAE